MTPDTLIRRIQADPRDDDAWSDLFRLLACGPAPGAAIELASTRHGIRRDAAVFTYHRVAELAAAGEQAALERLYQASGETGAFRGLFAYGLALCATREFRLEATLAFMREAAYVNAQGCRELFAHEDLFCGTILGQICQQASLIEGGAYAAGIPADPPVALPAMEPAGLLVLASCCDTYFQAYAERFIAQLAEALPEAWYLIHVLNPTAEGEALRTRLTGRFPQGGFSSETGPDDVVFLASRRFMVAPAVRTRYGCDLLVMDVDSVFKPGFRQILETSRKHGLAYFGNPDQLAPSLVVSAAFLYLPSDSAVADAVLANTASYLEQKLGEKMVPWTVDQAALFRALSLLGNDRARTADLARAIPGGLQAIVADGHEVPENVRLSHRVQYDTLNIEFDQDRRPILSVD